MGSLSGAFHPLCKIDFLVEKIAGTKLGQTGYSFMTDADGLIIAHPKKELILELDLKTVKGMEAIASQMLAHKTGVESYVFEGIRQDRRLCPGGSHRVECGDHSVNG